MPYAQLSLAQLKSYFKKYVQERVSIQFSNTSSLQVLWRLRILYTLWLNTALRVRPKECLGLWILLSVFQTLKIHIFRCDILELKLCSKYGPCLDEKDPISWVIRPGELVVVDIAERKGREAVPFRLNQCLNDFVPANGSASGRP